MIFFSSHAYRHEIDYWINASCRLFFPSQPHDVRSETETVRINSVRMRIKQWTTTENFLCRITFSTSTNTEEKLFRRNLPCSRFFSTLSSSPCDKALKNSHWFQQMSRLFFAAPEGVTDDRYVEHFFLVFALTIGGEICARNIQTSHIREIMFLFWNSKIINKYEIKLQLQNNRLQLTTSNLIFCNIKNASRKCEWSRWLSFLQQRAAHLI